MAARRQRRTGTLDYHRFVKKLDLPAGFAPPATLVHEGIVATALTRDDLADDVRGINASLDLINRIRGGGWPTEPVTEAYDYVDLLWHEREFREGTSFAYVVRDAAGGYLGCCYLYPLGWRAPLTEQLAHYDVDVSWWVTQAAYAQGHYAGLHRALGSWMTEHFPFWRPHFSNTEIPAPRSPDQ